MRLTLRTLLAYLDDTLEPAEASEIGQRVASNPAAQELIERIRKSIRRRSLAVPSSTKTGDYQDPNIVAQYLSDKLPSEALAEFEQYCQEHDELLAEVAACHQALSLLAAEQIRIPPATRRRMYDLAPHPLSLPNRKPGRTQPVVATIDTERPADDSRADAAYLMGLGMMSRQERGRMRWLRWAVAGGLAVLGVAALTQVWPEPLRTSKLETRTVAGGPATVNRPEEILPGAPAPNAPLQPSVVRETQDGNGTETGRLMAPLPREHNPILTKPTPTLPAEPATVPPPSREFAVIGQFESPANNPLIVLRQDLPEPSFQRLPEDGMTFISGRVHLLPPGYKAVLRLDGGLQQEAWANTFDLSPLSPVQECRWVNHLYRPGQQAAEITIEQGRFYFSSKRAGPAAVRLRIGELVWDVRLPDEKAELAVEVSRRLEPGPGQPQVRLAAALVALRGELELRRAGQEPEILKTGQERFWTSNNPDTAPVASTNRDTTYWSKYPTSPDGERAKEVYELLSETAKNLLESGNLRALAREYLSRKTNLPARKDVVRQEYALDLFASLEDLEALTDALNDPARLWVRKRAYVALRRAFATNPANVASFRDVLLNKTGLKEDKAELMLVYLRDLSREERTNPQILNGLLNTISLVEGGTIGLRESALQQLLMMLPPSEPKYSEYAIFDVASPLEARAAQIQLWRKKIQDWLTPTEVPAVPKPGG